ncbi:protein SCAR3-like isoform X1 [Carica papaya]|uniref:protein SCAR3-like isoform X1 n=2 Tax=Carica papaya TaxID=3649 RepID=UPI000B8CA4D1|nr:protein SCAR3-like isoform X1 [Carica papaya]XP_021907603.1 protein SCAR3-like isoform X1 [Carica papaya]
MPLVRFQVRNQYSLAQPQLYTEVNREDPKAVLDGVAVAGLVGILRQLGDLAEFAAEVFHGLQEQVMNTASRSHKLVIRVEHIEAALPPLEKAVLAQTSHVHFAYTAGHEWHPRIRSEQNHFICNDLPRFIMDSYEECRDPPRLNLLDKFDTNGPGSCLRRYSDPAFFRSASGVSTAADCDEVQKDKRSHKTKKKRSSRRNQELSRPAFISNRTSRMQFTSPIVSGRTSQNGSTVDMTFKSDIGDHLNSLDGRSSSGYIDCVFNLNSSLEQEEKIPKEAYSSLTQHIDTFASDFSEEKTQIVDDNFPYSPQQEQGFPSSPSFSWDEKAEIVESKGQQCDREESMDLPEINLGLDKQNREDVNPQSVDMLFGDVDTRKSMTNMNQLDEPESEPDNYMDALNTIESESENDVEYRKKPVKQISCDLDNERIEDGTCKQIKNSPDHHQSTYESPSRGMHKHMIHSPDHPCFINESHTTSYIPSNDGMSSHLPDSVSSENLADEHILQISGRSLDSDHSRGTDLCGSNNVFNGSKIESVSPDNRLSSSGSRISDSQNTLGNRIISTVCEPQSHPENFPVQPIKIWTNGGLLGLEPSKPPDFAAPNSLIRDLMTTSENEVGGHPNEQKERPGKLVENSQSIEKVSSSNNKKNSSLGVNLDGKLENSGDSEQGKIFYHADGAALSLNGKLAPGTMPVGPKPETDKNQSGVLGLGQKLLLTGFGRKVSLSHDGESNPSSTLNTEVIEQSEDHRISYQRILTSFKNEFGVRPPLDSLPDSPPLEHMKISFNPINDFETSKLKLKFPDGGHSLQSIRDMFPSFQLVPELPTSLHDIGFDSDDDTFCRSSPCMSDDCHSHYSKSNSEQWGSGETSESKDQELYDAFCRMSSMESVSSSLKVGETVNDGHVDSELRSFYTEDDADPSCSASLLDIPSFDSVTPALPMEANDTSDSKDLMKLQNPMEHAPLPPPLPPVEWWAKAHSDTLEGKHLTLPDALKHTFDVKLFESADSQQPKPSQANEKQSSQEETASKVENKADQWKHKRCKGNNKATNDKGMDEKEDFLHQIRTKSFNLRRTVAARPNSASGPPTNANVTAILEKANAIRQAVGSDYGEDDDNWSDT